MIRSAILVLLCATVAHAQEGLDTRAVLKQLEKFRAYGDLDRENKERPHLRLQFGVPPKSADVAGIVAVVKQSAVPVALNFNQCPDVDDQAVATLASMDKLVGLSLGNTKVTNDALKTIATLKNLEQLYLAGDILTDEGLVHLAELTKLRKLSVYSKKVTTAGFKHLSKLVNVEEFRVGDSFGIDDVALAAMKGMTKIRELWLGRDKVTDVGMAHVANLTGLRKLTVEGNKITEAGLKHLRALQNLEELSILSCSAAVKPEGFAHIGELPELKELTVIYSGAIDAKGSAALKKLTNLKKLRFDGLVKGSLEGIRGLKNLTSLDLNYSRATDECLEPLLEASSLRELNITNTSITSEGLKSLVNLKQLRQLYLSGTSVDDAGLVHLQALSGLEYLSLSECKIVGTGLKHLAGLPKLKDLSLSGNAIKDDALPALEKFPALTNVNLTGTKVNDDAALALKKALPKATIRDVAGDDVVLNPRKVERKLVGEDITSKEPHFKVTAADFLAEYKKNSQATKEKYAKKIVELTGEVTNMGTNFSNDPYLTLKVEGDFVGVMCITRTATPWASVLPGQTVTIKGEWPEFAFAAALVNCSVMKTGPAKHFELTAEALAKEVAADTDDQTNKKYKDKYIVLSGKVIDKTFNSAGAGTLTLETSGKPAVKCSFTAFDKSGVKAIKVGDTIRVAGQYTFNFGKDDVTIYFCQRMPAKP